MTYREHLKQLMANCLRKSEVYLNAVGSLHPVATEIERCWDEWERAEQAHTACLDLIRWHKISLDDPMPEYVDSDFRVYPSRRAELPVSRGESAA